MEILQPDIGCLSEVAVGYIANQFLLYVFVLCLSIFVFVCHILLVIVCADVPESSEVADVEPAPVFEHCTVCRNRLDATRRDSVFRHSMLSVLLCKVD